MVHFVWYPASMQNLSTASFKITCEVRVDSSGGVQKYISAVLKLDLGRFAV